MKCKPNFSYVNIFRAAKDIEALSVLPGGYLRFPEVESPFRFAQSFRGLDAGILPASASNAPDAYETCC